MFLVTECPLLIARDCVLKILADIAYSVESISSVIDMSSKVVCQTCTKKGATIRLQVKIRDNR